MAIKSLLRAGGGSQGFLPAFCICMRARSIDLKKGENWPTLNSEPNIVREATSGNTPLDWPFASLGCRSSGSALTRLPFSPGFLPRVDKPWRGPPAKLPMGTSPESLTEIISSLHSWFVYVNEVRPFRIWAARVQEGQVHVVRLEDTGASSFQLTGTPQ